MSDALNIFPTCGISDSDWDAQDVRDLVQTMPLRFDDDGLPVGYRAEHLFGLEGAYLGGRSS
jgi:hypothetical protein